MLIFFILFEKYEQFRHMLNAYYNTNTAKSFDCFPFKDVCLTLLLFCPLNDPSTVCGGVFSAPQKLVLFFFLQFNILVHLSPKTNF